MKLVLSISFFLCLPFGFSQRRSELPKIKLADFKVITKMEDLLPALPEGCSIAEYECIIKTGEEPVHVFVSADLASTLGIIRSKVGVGSRITLEIKKFTCPRALQKHYKFIVVE